MTYPKHVKLTPSPVFGRANKGHLKMGMLTDGERLFVRVQDDDTRLSDSLFNGPREEFLAGVAEAFDVLVIERSKLPEVKPDNARRGGMRAIANINGRLGDATAPDKPGPLDGLPEWHLAKAYAHLAVAAHLDAHPVVDREALGALSTTLLEEASEMTVFVQGIDLLARRLYDRGVRVVSE